MCQRHSVRVATTVRKLMCSTSLSGLTRRATRLESELQVKQSPRNPLEQLVEQINSAAGAGFELLAIGIAIALPAMCWSTEREDRRSDGKEYKEWCTQNLTGPDFTGITADDIYSIRCGVLNSGRSDIVNKDGSSKNANLAHVIFFPAGADEFTDYQINDVYA